MTNNEFNKDVYGLISLKKIFDDGKRSFRIPDYQRGYSWESNHREDLIKDIEYIIKGDFTYKHYTGTIVASENIEISKKNKIPVYDIVDGQQRLTSLVIILSILSKKLKSISNEILNLFLASDGETGNTIWKFVLTPDQEMLFKDIINNKINDHIEIRTKSDQNLIDAYNEFFEWITDDNANKIYKAITENIGFLFYSPLNTKEIGIMFEVINNRGKRLSQLEKIKNYLIYFSNKNDIADLKETVSSSWLIIMKNLNAINYTSNDEEDSFIRNCWLVFKDKTKNKSYYVYEQMKIEWAPDHIENWGEMKNFVEFVKNASETYKKIFNVESNKYDEVTSLENIKYSPQNASILPIILAIYEKVENSDERKRLLILLEKVNFRYYGTGIANRSDSGQGTLFEIAWKIYNQELDEDGESINCTWIENNLVKFIENKANDIAFVKSLTLEKDESGDYYSWAGLKYFLSSYENHKLKKSEQGSAMQKLMAPLDENNKNDFYHKEHIWAEEEFSIINDKDDKNINKRRLANFLLLSAKQNQNVGKESIQDKVSGGYKKSIFGVPNTLMIQEVIDLFEEIVADNPKKKYEKTKQHWLKIYTLFFNKREEEMIKFALERWRIEGLKNNIDFNKFKIDSEEI